MIPPLLYALPRLLLMIVPIFITIKSKEVKDDSTEKREPGSEPQGTDT